MKRLLGPALLALFSLAGGALSQTTPAGAVSKGKVPGAPVPDRAAAPSPADAQTALPVPYATAAHAALSQPAGALTEKPWILKGQRYARLATGFLDQHVLAKDVFLAYKMKDKKPHYCELAGSAQPRRYRGDKFAAFGSADFFPLDHEVVLPLLAKHGFSNTFYVQPVPQDGDFLRPTGRSSASSKHPELFQLIFNSGCQLEDHCFFHWAAGYKCAFADGCNFPSNDQLRKDQGDGCNLFAKPITQKLKDSFPMVYFLNSRDYEDKAWADLSDADCCDIRKSTSWINVPRLAATGEPSESRGTRVLECLDFLSNRYLGTTGYGRIPQGGLEHPSLDEHGYPTYTDRVHFDSSGRVAGGIFQRAATTRNHEIWERLFQLASLWASEAHGKILTFTHWHTAGGVRHLFNPTDFRTQTRYYDPEFALPFNIHTKIHSSIYGVDRSFFDVLKANGYTTARFLQGRSKPSMYSAHIKLNASVGKQFQILDAFPTGKLIGGGKLALSAADFDRLGGVREALAWRYQRDYESAAPAGFYNFVNRVVKETAWGVIPTNVNDNSWGAGELYDESIALLYEMAFMFCRLAGIEVVAFREAMDLAQQNRPLNNYFPNPSFRQTINDIIAPAALVQVSADGWVGGRVGFDIGLGHKCMEVQDGSTAYIRQFQLRYGKLSLSLQAKGKGQVAVYYILNRTDPGINDEPEGLEKEVVRVDSEGWNEVKVDLSIPERAREPVDRDFPGTEGYHNQICGLQFTIKADASGTLRIANCELK